MTEFFHTNELKIVRVVGWKRRGEKKTWTVSREEHYSPHRCRVLLTLVDGRLVFGVALDVLGEPLVKLVVGIEQRGHDEVQQGPQLRDSNNIRPSTVLSGSHEHTYASVNTHTRTHTAHLSHCVLDGRPGEQQSVSTLELQKDFPPNAEHTEKETLNVGRSGATTPRVYHVYSALNCAVITPPTQTLERCLCARVCFSFQDIFRLVL